jgi:hypothetical protein
VSGQLHALAALPTYPLHRRVIHQKQVCLSVDLQLHSIYLHPVTVFVCTSWSTFPCISLITLLRPFPIRNGISSLLSVSSSTFWRRDLLIAFVGISAFWDSLQMVTSRFVVHYFIQDDKYVPVFSECSVFSIVNFRSSQPSRPNSIYLNAPLLILIAPRSDPQTEVRTAIHELQTVCVLV